MEHPTYPICGMPSKDKHREVRLALNEMFFEYVAKTSRIRKARRLLPIEREAEKLKEEYDHIIRDS